MKTPSKIALVLGAFAVVGASAETYYTGQADQERRERNREEALAAYEAHHPSDATVRGDRETARERTHDAARSMRHEGHEIADSTRRVTHKTANAVRHAGHKTAEKAREVSDKANAKYGEPMDAGKANPEGINPRGVSSASPTAPSNGTTK